MAHNLAKKTAKQGGGTAFVAVVDDSVDQNGAAIRPLPWHGLGVKVDKAMTSKECIKLAGLDYRIDQVPLNWEYGTGKNKRTGTSEKFCQVVRADNGVSLGSVGTGFQVVQNVEAFDFFDSLVGDPKKDANKIAMFETAGALGEGEKIFITAKLPKQIRVGKDDLIDQYLFLYNGHDGSTPITVAFTPVRIVCNNTLNAALGNCKNKVVIKHTKNARERFKIAHEIMGLSNEADKYLSEVFNHMAKVKITDKRLKEYIAAVMSPKKEILTQAEFDQYSSRTLNLADDIMQYAATHDSQQLDTTKGTVFGAYNAITGYIQNMQDFKSEGDKLDSLVISELATEKKKVQKAYDFAMLLASKS